MAEILVADDDGSIRAALEMFLTSEHHAVRLAEDGEAALAAWREKRPHLLILDVMMPRKSGWDVCREIRATDPLLPIVMLTAKGTDQDKVIGLDSGADDYIVKPFSLAEFRSRVNAALRRARAADAPSADETARLGAYVVRRDRHVLIAPDGTQTPLSRVETKLLAYLAAHAGETVSKEDMFLACWPEGHRPVSRTLDVFMANLRKKMPLSPNAVRTVRGIGYRVETCEATGGASAKDLARPSCRTSAHKSAKR
jgi:DNA-binding response OmpR family regulator